MIETKEQYEETLDFLKINRFAYDEANEIEELIEALREVARATSRYGLTEDYDERQRLEEYMWDKLNALPDWIIDG